MKVMHDLDKYLLGQTEEYPELTLQETEEIRKYLYRVIEIMDYLNLHKDITNFVAIDDMDLSKGIEGHFVKTHNIIDDNQMEECIEILNK